PLDLDSVGELECDDVGKCPAAQSRNATNAALDARRRPRTVPRAKCRRQAAKCLCKEMRSVESSGGAGEVSGFVSRTRTLPNGADAWCARMGGASQFSPVDVSAALMVGRFESAARKRCLL